jgi:DNA-binding response OmpR family regulator
MASSNGDGPLVLVADDDEDILSLIAFRLGRDGYRVLKARDGEEALSLARERSPELIILDVRMPKMTGLDVVRELRASEGFTRVPIILLTASVQDDSVQRGFDAGADEYMKKPFSPQELAARVQAVVGPS